MSSVALGDFVVMVPMPMLFRQLFRRDVFIPVPCKLRPVCFCHCQAGCSSLPHYSLSGLIRQAQMIADSRWAVGPGHAVKKAPKCERRYVAGLAKFWSSHSLSPLRQTTGVTYAARQKTDDDITFSDEEDG